MQNDFLSCRNAVLPVAACADLASLACALDRAADAALFFGRTMQAERLAHRAAELREGGTI
jgi:hypothetical protein